MPWDYSRQEIYAIIYIIDMLNIIPIVAVVYKSKDENWRGFCHPYDLSCNAYTKEEAKENIAGLIETYEESLKRHGNPKHLIEKQLSDKEDQEKFKKGL